MNLHNKLSVEFRTQILENGKIVKAGCRTRNLILDSGMVSINSRSFLSQISYCALGDGTKPTKRDSGATTVSISSETATASANFFEASDVGRILKLDSGQEVKIDGFTSETSVSVTGADDDASSEFTIWSVNETSHENEIVRTNSTLGGENSNTVESDVVVFKRVFIFPEEVASQTYREIGWSWGSGSTDLFGRALIPGGGDSISAGQQYKVEVKLRVTPGPLLQTAVPDVSGGNFDTTGQMILGNTALFNGFHYRFLEPSEDKAIYLASSNFTLPTATPTILESNNSGRGIAGFPSSRGKNCSETFDSSKFEKTFTSQWGVSEGNGDIYGIGLNARSATDNRAAVAVLLDTPLLKDNEHTLELAFKLSWGRTLTN